MKTFLSILLIASALFTGSVQAKTPEHVHTYESKAGQTMDQFVYSIAKDMAWKTKMNGDAELCGEIESVGDGYQLKVYTINSVNACGYLKTKSSTYTGQTVHTHPKGVPGLVTTTFSAEDYQFKGYLIIGGVTNVQHQEGIGTERRVTKN